MLRKKGIISKWNDDKGFGFILPEDSKKTIFVHIKSFTDRNIRPTENQRVTYTLQNNIDGKGDSAINVSRSTDNPIRSKTNIHKRIHLQNNAKAKSYVLSESKTSYSLSILHILIILGFMLFLFHFSIKEGKLPPFTIIIYIAMGIITFFMYANDKSRAKNNEHRISENTLLLLSLWGGWVGALIAQHKLHHKNKKTSFQISFWGTVFFNILLLSFIFKIVTL